MGRQADGQKKPNNLIPKHWIDERLLSHEKVDGSQIRLRAACGVLNPILYTHNYKECTCAECNVVILGYGDGGE